MWFIVVSLTFVVAVLYGSLAVSTFLFISCGSLTFIWFVVAFRYGLAAI